MAKHIMLVKFKEEITDEKILEFVNDFTKRIHLIESLKGFNWGKDERIGDQQHGFTHVFEFSCESIKGVAEFLAHPEHVAFAGVFLPCLEKCVILDYKPLVVLP